MADQTVKINVDINSDTSGAQQAEAAIKKVDNGAQQAARVASNAGGKINDTFKQAGAAIAQGGTSVGGFVGALKGVAVGLGPVGIAIGLISTAIEAFLPQIGKLFGFKSQEDVDNYNKKLAETNDKIREVADAKSRAAEEEFLSNLDTELASIQAINDEYDRMVVTRLKIKDIQAGTNKAERELEKQIIDARTDISEAEKISLKNAVDARGIQEETVLTIEKEQAAIESARRNEETALKRVLEAEDDFTKKDTEVKADQTRFQELQARRKDLQRMQNTPGALYAEEEQAAAEEIEEINKKLKELSGSLPNLVTSRDNLKEKLKKEEDNRILATKSRSDIEQVGQARIDSARRGQEIELQKTSISTQVSLQTAETRSPAQIAKEGADAKKAAQMRLEAEQTAKRLQQQSILNAENQFTGATSDAAAQFATEGNNPRARGTNVASQLKDIAGKLADGTDQRELEQVAKQLSEATRNMGGSTVSTLTAVLQELQRQAQQIENLKGQIKTNRTL